MGAPLTPSGQDRHAAGYDGITRSGQLRAEHMEPALSLHHQEEPPLVMLVDDDPAVGAMFGIGLDALGFRVEVVSSPSAVFLAIEKEMPDLVVLDFNWEASLLAWMSWRTCASIPARLTCPYSC